MLGSNLLAVGARLSLFGDSPKSVYCEDCKYSGQIVLSILYQCSHLHLYVNSVVKESEGFLRKMRSLLIQC